MHRIDADGHVGNQFDAGDPLVPRQPTQVDAAWLNAVQNEIATVVEERGVVLSKPVQDQLHQALPAMSWCTVTCTSGVLSLSGAVRVLGVAMVSASSGTFEIDVRSGSSGLASNPAARVVLTNPIAGTPGGYEFQWDSTVGPPPNQVRIQVRNSSGAVNITSASFSVHILVVASV